MSILACTAGCWTKRVTTIEQFNREISIRGTDPETGIPNFIQVEPDTKVSIGDFWKRYEQFFRIPPSALERIRTVPDDLEDSTVTIFRQVHLGYPVSQGGYAVKAEHGRVRSAKGHFLTNLPHSLPRPISKKAALEVAIGSLGLQGPPPWTLPSSQGRPPEASLSLMPAKGDDSLKLIWRVSFEWTGIPTGPGGRTPLAITIDALNAAIIAKEFPTGPLRPPPAASRPDAAAPSN